MNLKIGIVGLPNAGKSTLFNALLKKQVAFAANYPFATIEPNIGVVPVPDERLATLATITKEEESLTTLPPLVPATVEFVDIAGLVKGAAEGEGLGNKFLSHIREVDIICHVLRYFSDDNIIHTQNSIDPERDKQIVETELILADLQTVAKQQEPRMNATKEDKARWEVITKLKTELNVGKLAKAVLSQEEMLAAKDLHLITAKPVLYIANISESQLQEDVGILAICAETEAQLAGLSETEQNEYLTSLGLNASGLDRLIKKAYDTLGLISFLTTGELEAKAWTIRRGALAPQAAGVIHTDFEKKFIKADVVSFADFVEHRGWKASRALGKVRSEGKLYEMADGDVVEFKIGA